MPNRILKESICTSESIDQLTAFEETAFYRLIVNCDDYGRMDARAKILKAKLYPLKDISAECIETAINALVNAGLIIVYQVDGRPYLQLTTWERHQQVRSKRSKFPACDVKSADMISNDIKRNQMISNDIKCPRNPIQSESLSLSESVSVSESDDGGELHKIAAEHDAILTAAENAGFPRNEMTRAILIDLYHDHGAEKMLTAIKECAEYGASSPAYLRKVLEGKPKPQKSGKIVTAQQYEQRDYDGVQETAEQMFERLKGG